jgi:hypothetical protein
MSVYVDDLQKWPHARHACFKAGSCHMMADTLEELHALASRIGLRRSWFQPRSFPHYDLSPGKREAAVAAGAVERTTRELTLWRIELRAAGKVPA